MSIKQSIQTVAIAAVTTVVVAGTGAYAATSTGLIHTHDLANNAVTSAKIKQGAVHKADLAKAVQTALAKAGKAGAPGKAGAAGAAGKAGQDGADGRISLGSSVQFDSAGLALDAAPGADGSQGSSGFGWDNDANTPVKSIKVDGTANLTVVALQPTEQGQGTFVLSFDSSTLAFVSAAGCSNVDDRTGAYGAGYVVCTTDFSHTTKGIGVTFTGIKASAYTEVTVQADNGTDTATQIVPVSVTN